MSTWLNLGSGPFPADDPWVNVDALEQMPGVDVVANAIDGLPFEDNSVERIYAGHVFEHCTYLEQLPLALAECARVLAPGGTMMVVGPDLDRTLWTVHEHEVKGMWPTDPDGERPAEHSWPPTAAMQRDALAHAGWDATELPIANVGEPWPVVSHIGWQFAFECTYD